ncbi:EamA family transporter [Aquibacillus rhizosphaerae]|uniref:DMT family transporter n=1 Tax=Aquibacillus rhizosphaerae TaxID=3051431 RepID=A0ABT7L191_9BACI|nr:DMT family transporter [Aquibacillus sp. LR5S19]MDL4839610.1 DMT family transporter [Aquibacillus sp. LR5S19]
MNIYIAYGLVIIGAAFWGVTGLFVQMLYSFGFSPWEVVTIRMTVSSFILFVSLYIFKPWYLKIKWRDLPYFFGLGIFSIAFFNWCYFAVIERASLSIAVILVYTSPIFASIIARFLFKEFISKQKAIAIILMLIGCGFVVGLFPNGLEEVSLGTVLLGVLAGFFCSLYSVIGKHVCKTYHPVTITIYSLICGSLFMIPTSSIWQKASVFTDVKVWLYILGISIISTIFAYTLYTLGLTYIESSKAAILSTVELIVSMMIGIFIFQDVLSGWQWSGFFLVIISLFLTIFAKQKIPKNSF